MIGKIVIITKMLFGPLFVTHKIVVQIGRGGIGVWFLLMTGDATFFMNNF